MRSLAYQADFFICQAFQEAFRKILQPRKVRPAQMGILDPLILQGQ